MQYDDVITNSRWRTDANLKIALSPYLSRELSDFDQIWYADVDYDFHDGHLIKNRNFANSRFKMDAILKIIFLAISQRHIGQFMQFRNGDEESHSNISRLTKMTILAVYFLPF